MYLAITLSRLDDFTNACAAYEKAIEIEAVDPVFHLNYAVTLFNHGDLDTARERFKVHDELYADQAADETPDKEVEEMRQTLQQLL